MKLIINILLLASITCHFLFGGEPTPLPEPLMVKRNILFERMDRLKTKNTIDSLSSEEIRLLTRYLKQIVVDKQSIYSAGEANYILLDLGDDATIQQSLKDFLENTFQREIFSANNPKVVIAAAPYLFREESYHPLSGGDYIINQVSFATMYGIQNHLTSSPYYSAEVNQWARHIEVPEHLTGEKKIEFQRNIMRRWWNANRAAFLRGDYLAVKPGENYPESEPLPSPSATFAEPASLAKITPLPTPRSSPIRTAAPVVPVSAFPIMALVALLGAIVLAGAGYIVFKRRE